MTENEDIKQIRKQICNEKGVQRYCRDNCMHGIEHCAYSIAIQALSEIQQYRAIGTVEELQKAKMQYDGINSVAEKIALIGLSDYGTAKEAVITEIKRSLDYSLKEYQSIGTIEEFKALKEKQYDCTIKHLTNECSYKETGCSDCKGYWKIRKLLEKNVAKKSKEVHENEICIDFICPNCKEAVYGQPYRPNYCKHCGQKLDWE